MSIEQLDDLLDMVGGYLQNLAHAAAQQERAAS